jgi:hypothetical protein
MGQDNVSADQRKRLTQHLAHTRQFAGMEDVRGIDGDLQVRRVQGSSPGRFAGSIERRGFASWE